MRRRGLLPALGLAVVPSLVWAKRVSSERKFSEFPTLSTEEGADGYQAWRRCRFEEGRSIEVYLDGKLVRHVAASCERRGFVRHALENEEGDLYLVWSEAYQERVFAEEVVWGEVVHKIGPPTSTF